MEFADFIKDELELFRAFANGYVDSSTTPLSGLTPSFVYNSYTKDDTSTVAKAIIANLRELKKGDEFYFPVAFVTKSGLIMLKGVLQELAERGVKGKFITTNYQYFNSPEDLAELSKITNMECRIHYQKDAHDVGFHTKGYIFKTGSRYKAIIGSSNLTQNALSINQEWNCQIVGTEDGSVIRKILEQFNLLWSKSRPLDEETLRQYKEDYGREHVSRSVIAHNERGLALPEPNEMQREFIAALNASIEKGEDRGLLISSTGTGKTYASAFGVKSIKKFEVKHLLYVTHRENILNKAIESYQRIFGRRGPKMELLSGNNHDIDGGGFVFATLDTIRMPKYRNQFSPDHFDVVIIDEAHRISESGTYQSEVISYFKPKYLLGMTATPDRTDNYDVYGVFNHNILYEIRLIGALEGKMLCPFHYFGITDLTVNGKRVDDKTAYNDLTADERVNRIVEQSEYFGYSGKRLKGLIFLSRVDEGKELAHKLTDRGYKAVFIDGTTPEWQRAQYIKELEEDDESKPQLDFILTVGIFNEGVDIPSVNQIILLRPTESQILFVQQLGRGLRLHDDKEFLVVLDFIRNYDNNFLIPMSFAQKGAGVKNELARATIIPSLPGPSTVEFDPIAQAEILASIEKTSIMVISELKKQYQDIKNRLGRSPTLIEFDSNGDITGRSLLDFAPANCKSYFEFMKRYDKDLADLAISPKGLEYLRHYSKWIGNGLRIIEPLILKGLIEGKDIIQIAEEARSQNLLADSTVLGSAYRVINGDFSYKAKTTHAPLALKMDNGKIVLHEDFINELRDPTFKEQLTMILDYAFYSYERYFKPEVGGRKAHSKRFPFTYYEKYSRANVCRVASLPNNDESTMYGYRCYEKEKFLPIFVTYSKEDLDPENTIAYDDKFINPSLFQWISRNGRTLDSKEIKDCIKILNNGTALLFVKKINKKNAKDDDNDFYFLGQVKLDPNPSSAPENAKMSGSNADVVRFRFVLNQPVPKDIYAYLTSPVSIDDNLN